MHYVTVKGILSSHNGMNIYRGCQHGCIYCDARSDCYQMDHAFEDIEVKENAYEVTSPRHQELTKLFHHTCRKHGILHNNDEIFRYLNQFEEKTDQISFFD